MKRKIAVSVPEELVAFVEREVAAGRTASVSAYVSEALAAKVGNDELLAVLDEMDATYGKPSKEADEWAKRVLGLS